MIHYPSRKIWKAIFKLWWKFYKINYLGFILWDHRTKPLLRRRVTILSDGTLHLCSEGFFSICHVWWLLESLPTYWMELSMRVMVRKAARFAVYDEMTIRANNHHAPIIIRVARVVYGTSPPVERGEMTATSISLYWETEVIHTQCQHWQKASCPCHDREPLFSSTTFRMLTFLLYLSKTEYHQHLVK